MVMNMNELKDWRRKDKGSLKGIYIKESIERVWIQDIVRKMF